MKNETAMFAINALRCHEDFSSLQHDMRNERWPESDDERFVKWLGESDGYQAPEVRMEHLNERRLTMRKSALEETEGAELGSPIRVVVHEDAETTLLIESGRPNHVLVVTEGATECGYYCEVNHRETEAGDLDSMLTAANMYGTRCDEFLTHNISMVFGIIGQDSYDNAVAHGFWSGTSRRDRNDGEAISLMHSELSEMLESVREGNPQSEKIPEYSNTEEEGADLLIRLFDWSQGRNLDIAGALIAKMKYNRSRPHKHDKKF